MRRTLAQSTPPGVPPASHQEILREALKQALPGTVSLLKSCRAAEIVPTRIDAYVALNWLEWNGGSLRLTVTGANICSQVAANRNA